MIDVRLASGEKFGYIFESETTVGTSTKPPRFIITARPQLYRKSGKKSFRIDDECILRGQDIGGIDVDSKTDVLITCPNLNVIPKDNENDIKQALRYIHSAQETYISTMVLYYNYMMLD